MEKSQRIARLADALDRALANGIPIPPITITDPDQNVADACAVQLRNVARAQARGAVILSAAAPARPGDGFEAVYAHPGTVRAQFV